MTTYRKKLVVVEAIRFERGSNRRIDWNALTEFFNSKSGDGTWQSTGVHVYIFTLEGRMRADLGDWIIKGVAGEFYPCKPDIFEKTYEAVAS